MSEPKSLPISIRQASEHDAPLIFNSWLKSFRENGIARAVESSVYYSEQHKLIEKLLKRSKTFIAHEVGVPENIYGWACFERVEGILVIHYIYVKHSFRGLGIARELMKETEHDFANASLFTHWTNTAARIGLRKNCLYHPYILMNY